MSIFSCPVCRDILTVSDSAYVCPRGHSFDIAREGYVNLLPTRSKTAKFPGDTKPMLLARRAFLEKGYYVPLSDAINAIASEYLAENSLRNESLADIGAGEGWYINRLDSHLRSYGRRQFTCYGIDVSKDAVRLAAKRYRNITFAAADIWQRLPFLDESLNVLLNVFAPRNTVEFARVLDTGGQAIVVIPDEGHLAELHSEITMLGIEPDKQQQIIDKFAQYFVLFRQEAMRITLMPDGCGLYDLVSMTPNARHISNEIMEGLKRKSMRVTARFNILDFRKNR